MPRSITAALLTEAGGPFRPQTVILDDPGPREVVVRIHGIGVCHTDIADRDGFFGLAYPMLLGHEGSGQVVDIGAGVSTVAIGDMVAISFASCGKCRECERHQPAYCIEFGARNYGGGVRDDGTTPISWNGAPVASAFFGQSSFAEYALASEQNVVKIDEDIPIELVGPLGCGIQTGAGAVFNSMNCRSGESILILGAGPVGLAAVMAAKIRGCAPIIVSDPNAGRCRLARDLGATASIDPTAGALGEQVGGLVGNGVD